MTAGLLAAAFTAVVATGCAPAGQPTVSVFELTPEAFALEIDPVDSIGEWVQDSDLIVVGTITDVRVEPLGESTPLPREAPEMVSTVERVTIVVTPLDGSSAIEIVSNREYLVTSDYGAALSRGPFSFPREPVIFALDVTLEGDAFQCTTYDSNWCGLIVRDGVWVAAESTASAELRVVPGPSDVVNQSIVEGAATLLAGTKTPVVGIDVPSTVKDASTLLGHPA